ncbi:ATP-binding cassette domain-containing protein, partial [Paenibacillus sp. MCAF20]
SYELLKDIYKIPPKRYEDNLRMLTETLDLAEFIRTPVRQLSLGQRMRCEIAASLLHSPSVLFLDEPTIGLDAVSKLAVRQFIKTINKEQGVTVILTTHDMADIEALADRILMIGKGTLLYDGSLEQLRRRFGVQEKESLDEMIVQLYKEHQI